MLRRASCFFLGFVVSCSSVAREVRPDEPNVVKELDPDGKWQCRSVGERGEPLVVDLAAHERTNIETAMRDGVAVVAYDCKTMRLLDDCSVEGSYGFVSVSRKEDVMQLEDVDELRGNLPAGVLASELAVEVQSGRSLDIAMILVGKRRTTVRHAGHAALRGGPACAGATHFVKGAHMGAFALDIGTQGAARTAVTVFASASGKSSKVSQYSDGQPEKCEQLVDDTPNPSCNALVRLELVALDGDVASDTGGAVVASPCPQGMQLVENKCAVATRAQLHLCKYGDAGDCTAQCSAGDAASCGNLGQMYAVGEGVTKDPARAVRLLDGACAQGVARACTGSGLMHLGDSGVARDPVIAAGQLQRGCNGGDAQGCGALGNMYYGGTDFPQDAPRAVALYDKACNAGLPAACAVMGAAYLGLDMGATATPELALPKGGLKGLPPDPEKGVALMQRACDGSLLLSCGAVGLVYVSGLGGARRDPQRGLSMLRRACDGGVQLACDTLAMLARGNTQRGYMGVNIRNLEPSERATMRLGGTGGVSVDALVTGGPAATAGLRTGDVILTLNAKPVESMEDFIKAVTGAGSGAIVQVGLVRAQQPMTLMVKLESHPDDNKR